ncbi:MAG: large repetitive protein [Mycobacteriales bacterium]
MVGATGLTWVGRVTTATGLGVLGLVAVPGVASAAPLQAHADSATVGRATGVASGNVLSNDVDADGHPASPSAVGVSLLSPPPTGSARLGADGHFTFAPGACFVGTTSFRYLIVANDDSTNTAIGTVSVTVGEFASAPLARNDFVRVDAGGAVQGSLLGNDCGPGAQASASSVLLSSSPISGPSKGSVIIDASSGTFTYQPRAGATGADSFRYQITSRANPELTSSATVTISIIAPTAPGGGNNGGGNNGGGNNGGGNNGGGNNGGGTNGGGGGGPSNGGPGTGRTSTGTQGGGLGQLAPAGTGSHGAGALAAPRPQLPATGTSHVLPTSLTGFGLIVGGLLAIYAGRRKETDNPGAEPAV